MRAPATIAVDLTPVLAGGENGGAKVVALALVPLLAEIAPESRFILLTTLVNQDELAALDAPNVQRFCVDAPAAGRGAVENLALRARAFLSRAVSAGGIERIAAMYRRFKRAQGAPSLLEQLGVEVLFCPFLAAFYSDGRTPFVTMVADLQFSYFPEFFPADERARLQREFDKVARDAARIVCLSNYVRETVIQAGALADRTVVIPPALHNRFSNGRADHRCEDVIAKWPLVPHEYLLYPANFWRHKNHAKLIEAVQLFTRRTPDSRLKIVLTGAGGTERDNILENVRTAGLSERVVLAGFVPNDELYALLRCSLALVFPSLFEGFGIPVLEAMAAGTPVLCSNSTSLPEVAGDAALLFDPDDPEAIADAIARIVDDPQFRRALIERGFARAASFGTARDMAALYWKAICDAALLR